jgi:hypothetical protein
LEVSYFFYNFCYLQITLFLVVGSSMIEFTILKDFNWKINPPKASIVKEAIWNPGMWWNSWVALLKDWEWGSCRNFWCNEIFKSCQTQELHSFMAGNFF